MSKGQASTFKGATSIAEILRQRQEAHEAQIRSQQTTANKPLSNKQQMWQTMADPQLALGQQLSNPRTSQAVPGGPGDSQAAPLRHTGKVKWYDRERGLGKLECSETMRIVGDDISLLESNLKGVVPQTGDVCQFTLHKNPKGGWRALWKAIDCDWIQGQGAQARDHRVMQAMQEVQVGKIASFDTGKGFGFIECEALRGLFNKDIFFMKTELKGSQTAYYEGAQVYFRFRLVEKGTQCTAVSMNAMDLTVSNRVLGQIEAAPGLVVAPQFNSLNSVSAGTTDGFNAASMMALASGEVGPVRSSSRRSKWDDSGPYERPKFPGTLDRIKPPEAPQAEKQSKVGNYQDAMAAIKEAAKQHSGKTSASSGSSVML